MKPTKRGYKVWCLADSKTGYVLKFEIYIGKSECSSDGDGATLGERVVKKLTTPVFPNTVVAFIFHNCQLAESVAC